MRIVTNRDVLDPAREVEHRRRPVLSRLELFGRTGSGAAITVGDEGAAECSRWS